MYLFQLLNKLLLYFIKKKKKTSFPVGIVLAKAWISIVIMLPTWLHQEIKYVHDQITEFWQENDKFYESNDIKVTRDLLYKYMKL